MNRAGNRRSTAQTEEWREIQLPEAEQKALARISFSCTAVEHWVYVIGGRRRQGSGNALKQLKDVLRYNCLDGTWEQLEDLPITPRGDHTAVLVGSKIWVLGGNTPGDFTDSVVCLDTDTLRWRTQTFRGQHLLARTAHAAVQHPTKAEAILVYAGYGIQGGSDNAAWLGDLLLVQLDRKEVRVLSPNGAALKPRGYHAMAAVGRCVYVFGGRRDSASDPVSETEALVIYNSEANTWLVPRQVSGKVPPMRSSTQVTSYCTRHDEWHLVVHGGLHGQQRLDDCHILAVTAGGKRLAWSKLTARNPPPGRSAHGLTHYRKPGSVVLLCMGGHGYGYEYFGDVWSLELPITPAQAPPAPAEPEPVPARHSAGTWRSKRPLAAQPEDGPALKLAASKPAHQRGLGLSSGQAAAAGTPVPYAELQAQVTALQAQVQQHQAADELQRRNLKDVQDRVADLTRQVTDTDRRLKASNNEARRQGEVCERQATASAAAEAERARLDALLQQAAADQQALARDLETSTALVQQKEALLQDERGVAEQASVLLNNRNEDLQARHREEVQDYKRKLTESEQRNLAAQERLGQRHHAIQALEKKLADAEASVRRDKLHADLAEETSRRRLAEQDQIMANLRDQLKTAEAAASQAVAARTQAVQDLGTLRDGHAKAIQDVAQLNALLKEKEATRVQLAAQLAKLREFYTEDAARGEREARSMMDDGQHYMQEGTARLAYWKKRQGGQQ